MRPGDTIKRVDASTEPATVFLEVCDENGEVQIWQGTSTANVVDVTEGMTSRRSVFGGEDVTEDLTNTGNRVRTSDELAKAERLDARDAAATEREAIQSMVSGLTDIVEADTPLTEAEQTEALKKLARICRLVVDMV